MGQLKLGLPGIPVKQGQVVVIGSLRQSVQVLDPQQRLEEIRVFPIQFGDGVAFERHLQDKTE